MGYSIREGKIKSGRKFVPVFEVRDETGATRANESSQALAEAHIKELEAANERNAKADLEFRIRATREQ